MVGRYWGRVNAEGAVRGVRGGRVVLMGGDVLAEVGGVGVGTPLRPEVNYLSVQVKDSERETYETRIPITRN